MSTDLIYRIVLVGIDGILIVFINLLAKFIVQLFDFSLRAFNRALDLDDIYGFVSRVTRLIRKAFYGFSNIGDKLRRLLSQVFKKSIFNTSVCFNIPYPGY